MSAPNLQSMLCLSVAHLTTATRDAIIADGLSNLSSHGCPASESPPGLPASLLWPCSTGWHGWICWVDEAIGDAYPDLEACVTYARSLGAQWVRFDVDEEAIGELRNYEFEASLGGVEMRPPRKGERGWWVHAREEAGAREEVIREGAWSDGSWGWEALEDHPARRDDEGMIAVTLTTTR